MITEDQKTRLFEANISNDDRTQAINNRYKWDVNLKLDADSNQIPRDNGYFGGYTLIKYKGKETIVFVDDRDGLVHVCSVWADKILYGSEYKNSWDGDHRWNRDRPVVVYDNGLYNLNAPHKPQLMMNQWVKELDDNWHNNRTIGDYLYGKDVDGNEIIVLSSGVIKQKSIHTSENLQTMLSTLKTFDAKDAERLWVDKGLPCAYQRGLTFRGARTMPITQERAKELIRTHREFNGRFNNLAWEVHQGEIYLVFHDYSGSDYD